MSSIKHAPCPCCYPRRDAALRGLDLKAPTAAPAPARFVSGAAGDQPSRPPRAPVANEIILCAHRIISVPRSRTRSDALRDDSGAHAGIGSMHARPHCQLSLLTAVSTFPSTPKPASGEPICVVSPTQSRAGADQNPRPLSAGAAMCTVRAFRNVLPPFKVLGFGRVIDRPKIIGNAEGLVLPWW